MVRNRLTSCVTCGFAFRYTAGTCGKNRTKCFICKHKNEESPSFPEQTGNCLLCGIPIYKPKRGPAGRFCCPSHKTRWHQPPDMTCGVDGCTNRREPHKHKCVTCRTRPCDTCGKQSANKFCSQECFRYPIKSCGDCGQAFEARSSSRTCGTCAQARRERIDVERRQRRRLLEGSGERFTRREIFERDGWECRICGIAVSDDLPPSHPQKANLDHVRPINPPPGVAAGTHTRANVQTLCRVCNRVKSNQIWDREAPRPSNHTSAPSVTTAT